MKVAIIGLDGLEPALAFDELEASMPTLAELGEEGVHGSIASTHPPERVPAWATLLTGQDPGRHGLMGERNRDWQRTRQGRRAPYGEGARASSAELKAATLWQRANEADREVALAGVPLTYPVEPVEGALVAGDPAPGEAFATHPPELADELADATGVDGFQRVEAGSDREATVEQARAGIEERFAVAEHLARERSWELFVTAIPELRAVQRAAWSTHDEAHPLHEPGAEDAVRAAYEHVDERLAALVEAFPDDTAVLVVSEAGAQPSQGTLELNAWLRREGYLSLARDVDEPRAFDPELVDWSQTTAWATGGAAGRIHVNLEGREPAGTVDPLDYEAVREELAEALAAVETSEGTLAVQALKPREVHEGPRADEGPDLLCYAEELAVGCGARLGAEEVACGPRAGVDEAATTLEGAFVLADPEERFSGQPEDLRLADAAATALDLLDAETDGLDGRVLQPDGSLKQP